MANMECRANSLCGSLAGAAMRHQDPFDLQLSLLAGGQLRNCLETHRQIFAAGQWYIFHCKLRRRREVGCATNTRIRGNRARTARGVLRQLQPRGCGCQKHRRHAVEGHRDWSQCLHLPSWPAEGGVLGDYATNQTSMGEGLGGQSVATSADCRLAS